MELKMILSKDLVDLGPGRLASVSLVLAHGAKQFPPCVAGDGLVLTHAARNLARPMALIRFLPGAV